MHHMISFVSLSVLVDEVYPPIVLFSVFLCWQQYLEPGATVKMVC